MAFEQSRNALTDAADRIEAELRRLVRTVDDEVVPEVRRHGSSALRTLSAKLAEMAQSLDDARGRQAAPPPPPPPGDGR